MTLPYPTLGAESDVDMCGALLTAQKQPGDAQQNHRHGDLRNDEKTAEADAVAAAGESIVAFECMGEARARGCPGRSKAKQQSADRAQQE